MTETSIGIVKSALTHDEPALFSKANILLESQRPLARAINPVQMPTSVPSDVWST
jgi:hypothetical protein